MRCKTDIVFLGVPVEVVYAYQQYDEGDMYTPPTQENVSVLEVYIVDSEVNIRKLLSNEYLRRLESLLLVSHDV